MADSQRDDPLNPEAPEGAAVDPDLSNRTPEAEAPAGCGECGFPHLTLIRDAEIVSVYKCPQCGQLSAPVKRG